MIFFRSHNPDKLERQVLGTNGVWIEQRIGGENELFPPRKRQSNSISIFVFIFV